jgi:hypothetical protein
LDRSDFTRRVLIVVGFGYAHTKQASALILKGTDQLIQVKAFLCVPGRGVILVCTGSFENGRGDQHSGDNWPAVQGGRCASSHE